MASLIGAFSFGGFMGDTVLTLLRKIKHPNIQSILKNPVFGCYPRWRNEHSRFTVHKKINEFEIGMAFKYGQETYSIFLYPDTFSLVRKRVDKFNDYTGFAFREPLNVVADVVHLEYNDFEAALFQQSLLGELGMFGVQEAEVLLQLRDIYFKDTK